MNYMWIDFEEDFWHVLVYNKGTIVYYRTDAFIELDASDDMINGLVGGWWGGCRSWGNKVIGELDDCGNDVVIRGRYMEFVRMLEGARMGKINYREGVRFMAKGG